MRGLESESAIIPAVVALPELGTVGSVSVIEKKFGNAGNLEIVAGVGTSMDFLWRDSGPAFVRNGPTPIAAKGISPMLIQSRFGAKETSRCWQSNRRFHQTAG
jgi:hypothetical protein